MVPDWHPGGVIIFAINKDQREAVRHAQRVLRIDETGSLDDFTRARLRGFQGLFGLAMTGCLDPKTAEKIEEIRNAYA
jgi:hypothetical protein